jgi:hypothetical protein
VTLTAQATGVSDVFWIQQGGTPVISNVATGAALSFVAPSEFGTLHFSAFANVNGTLIQDDVQVTVQVTAPPPPEPAASPSIAAGEVFVGGVSLLIYSGGSTDDLVSAIACPLSELGIWASAPDGNLVQYTLGRPAFVNAGWTSLFPGGLPDMTPLMVKCG